MMVSIQEADGIVLRWQQMMRRGMMINLKADERKKPEVPSSYFRFRLGTLPREVSCPNRCPLQTGRTYKQRG